MKKYRVTFHDGPCGSKSLKYDIEAENSDEAFNKAYKDLRAKGLDICFTDSTTEEWPNGTSNIGIEFNYLEGRQRRAYSQYMIIRAENEQQAVEFYNRNFKGKRFYQPWPCKVEENGNCEYRNVARTYFAACPGADFDATGAGMAKHTI